MRFQTIQLTVVLSALLLTACGGSDSSGHRANITAVKVAGDSLSDSGVFGHLPAGSGYGRIFSVNGSADEPSVLWTERLAATFGVSAPCNFFTFTGTTFANTVGCDSYAVGGGRINNAYKAGAADGTGTPPFSIPSQLQVASSAGNFKTTDLLLVDGGGNDAADLLEAYLLALAGTPSGLNGILSTLSVAAPTDATSQVTSGVAYMAKLADSFYASIKSNALDKGATHVAVLNMPPIAKTPAVINALDIFQASLQSTAGYSATNAAAIRAGIEATLTTWITAYNTELSAKFTGDSRVVVVDFYSSFLDQITNPMQYGLTNVSTPACPSTGVNSNGVKQYNFETCTATSLSANPPAGVTGGASWWKNYAFSDGFHPTPYGHQLLSQTVVRALTQAGWL